MYMILSTMPASGSIEMQMVGDLNLLKPNKTFRIGGYFVWSTLLAYHKDEKKISMPGMSCLM